MHTQRTLVCVVQAVDSLSQQMLLEQPACPQQPGSSSFAASALSALLAYAASTSAYATSLMRLVRLSDNCAIS